VRGRLRLGIDLGGAKTEDIILDPEGYERFHKRLPTDSSCYDGALNGILDP
jgi:N-methylhydantoinase A/oxoprolinase/acetone carboxylase beta subunit